MEERLTGAVAAVKLASIQRRARVVMEVAARSVTTAQDSAALGAVLDEAIDEIMKMRQRLADGPLVLREGSDGR